MTTQINLTFYNNQNWFLPFNMAQWARLYDLTQGIYRLHVRTAPGAVPLVYGFSSEPDDDVGGVVMYDPTTQYLYSVAPSGDMRLLAPGTYAYDLQYTPGLTLPSGVALVQDLAVGTLQVTSGVTRS